MTSTSISDICLQEAWWLQQFSYGLLGLDAETREHSIMEQFGKIFNAEWRPQLSNPFQLWIISRSIHVLMVLRSYPWTPASGATTSWKLNHFTHARHVRPHSFRFSVVPQCDNTTHIKVGGSCSIGETWCRGRGERRNMKRRCRGNRCQTLMGNSGAPFVFCKQFIAIRFSYTQAEVVTSV
jgi:hypothetical protein